MANFTEYEGILLTYLKEKEGIGTFKVSKPIAGFNLNPSCSAGGLLRVLIQAESFC